MTLKQRYKYFHPFSLILPSYFGGLPSAMAFLPRAELSTTFILVVFMTPHVCQIW